MIRYHLALRSIWTHSDLYLKRSRELLALGLQHFQYTKNLCILESLSVRSGVSLKGFLWSGSKNTSHLYLSICTKKVKRIVGPGASTLSVHKNLCTLESLSVRSGVSLKGFWRFWAQKHGSLVLVRCIRSQENCWPWGFQHFQYTKTRVYLKVFRYLFEYLWAVLTWVSLKGFCWLWPKNTGERDLGPLYVSHVPAGRFVLEEIKRIVGPGASTLSVHKNLCTLESLSVRSGVSLKGFWRFWPKNTGPSYLSDAYAVERMVGPGASTLSVHKNLCTLESLSVRSGVSLKGFWRLWPKNTGERGLGSLYVLHVLGL